MISPRCQIHLSLRRSDKAFPRFTWFAEKPHLPTRSLCGKVAYHLNFFDLPSYQIQKKKGLSIDFNPALLYTFGSITGNATGNATETNPIRNGSGLDGRKDFFYIDMVTLPYPGFHLVHLGIKRKQTTVLINILKFQNAIPCPFGLCSFNSFRPHVFVFNLVSR
jgi:hypothetical protein